MMMPLTPFEHMLDILWGYVIYRRVHHVAIHVKHGIWVKSGWLPEIGMVNRPLKWRSPHLPWWWPGGFVVAYAYRLPPTNREMWYLYIFITFGIPKSGWDAIPNLPQYLRRPLTMAKISFGYTVSGEPFPLPAELSTELHPGWGNPWSGIHIYHMMFTGIRVRVNQPGASLGLS